MLDTFRFLAGFAWFAIFLFFTGSPYRWVLRKETYRDRQNLVVWFFAVLQSGYFARLVLGHAPAIELGASYGMTLGLQVLSLLIALRIFHIRFDQQGFRW